MINVLILRFKVVRFADIDALLLTYGTIVGYIIIVSAIIANYIIGANLSYLELIVNGLGIILFIAVGGVAFSHENSTDQGWYIRNCLFSMLDPNK